MSEKFSFLAELKRRNVYKVAVAYAVVAWLLMQVASQIFRSSKFQTGANLVDPTHENRAGLAESSHIYLQEQGREDSAHLFAANVAQS